MNGKENAECSSASAQRASQTRESIKEEKDVREIHLMLAEDNELNAEIVKALLEKRGITVDVAQDGRKALKMFKSHGSGTYSLILMDMMMPDMDGLHATRAIRALIREDARTIPIVAMTANTALEAGMDSHLATPFNPAALNAILEGLSCVPPEFLFFTFTSKIKMS